MKITMFGLKNTLNGINDSFDVAEEKICELKDIAIETNQNKTQKEKKRTVTNEMSVNKLWDNFKAA